MSHSAINWAYKQPVKNAGAKFVLVALSDFADINGYSFYGQDSLAQMTSQSDRSVRAHLKHLEEEGYIRREHRYKKDGTRTSDGCYVLAPAEVLNPALQEKPAPKKPRLPEESAASKDDYRKIMSRLPEESAARLPEEFSGYPSELRFEPSEEKPSGDSADASPPNGSIVETPLKHLLRELQSRIGKIPDGRAQAGAAKWLLDAGHSPDDCVACLDALFTEEWRTAAVSWLTVKKEIGAWKLRRNRAAPTNNSPPVPPPETAAEKQARLAQTMKERAEKDAAKGNRLERPPRTNA